MVLNRFQMAAVKRTAQNVKKLVGQRDKVNEKIHALAAELVEINNQIDAWETPIKMMTGGWTSEQCLARSGELPDEPQQDVVAEVASIHAEENNPF